MLASTKKNYALCREVRALQKACVFEVEGKFLRRRKESKATLYWHSVADVQKTAI